MAFIQGRQAGLHTADDAVNQLMERMQYMMAQHDDMMAQIKAEFQKEITSLRQQLTEARAELAKLQLLNAFRDCERSETDKLN
jgi:hypothetical protein